MFLKIKNYIMKKTISILIFFTGLFINPVFGQIDSLELYSVSDTQNVKVTLFDTDDLFEITLKFDITEYKRKRSDTSYLDAVLTYALNKTDTVSKNIRVRARGNIRRTAICDFPPLMLNFKMKDSDGTEFAGINKLKIVPYCKMGFENYILREYLVYKLYNVLTDYSFRVRLFKINYINSSKEKKIITQYGFAIEPKDMLERRAKAVEITYTGSSQRTIVPEMLDRMAIFNYMIGNTDWSVPINHNVVLFARPESVKSDENLIVPYDFDYAGIVNADYAIPFEALPIKTVRERLYTAVCRTEDVFTNELLEFSEKKDEFYKVINDFPYLDERSKKSMISYLDEFYSGFEKRNTLVRKFMNDCLWFENASNLRMR